MSGPRIICVGANLESEVVLHHFINNNIPVVGLVTSPGRKESKGSDYRNLIPFAHANDLSVIITEDINSDSTKGAIRKLKPDYIFILGWSQLFDKELINIPNHCIVGSHPSDLPYGAGRAPVPWTILEGLRESAVTFFEVTEGVDEGQMFLKKPLKIDELETANTLYKKVSENLAEGFDLVYRKIVENNLVGIPQSQEQSRKTIRAKRVFEDGFIDFNKTAKEVDCLIRAVTSPFPGAFTFYKGNIVKVWESSIPTTYIHKGVPGQILKKTKNELLVQCIDKPIILKSFSNEFDDELNVSEFSLGDKLGINLIFEYLNLKNEVKSLNRDSLVNGIY